MADRPQHCRPAAYLAFARELQAVDAASGLLRAATAISLHECADESIDETEAEVARLAEAIGSRLRSREPDAVLAHAHDVLFDEGGFSGNTEDYYNPLNSYLPAVLRRRVGLPITLALVYKCVLDRLGVRVHGVASPGHFMVAVEMGVDRSPMLVDPFHGGRTLTPDEAVKRIEQATGLAVPEPRGVLPIASHRMWLARMLLNLEHVFVRTQRGVDAAAMLELRALLDRPPVNRPQINADQRG